MALQYFPVDPGATTSFAQRFELGVHEGTDIFAPTDTPLFAVADGVVTHAEDPKGGRVVYLRDGRGRTYYYAHLSHYAYAESPREVEAGSLLGYVGTSGNALNRPPHLHFGIYESGGAIDPFPELAAIGPARAIVNPPSGGTNAWPLLALLVLLLWRK